jgi:hypothetical protein
MTGRTASLTIVSMGWSVRAAATQWLAPNTATQAARIFNLAAFILFVIVSIPLFFVVLTATLRAVFQAGPLLGEPNLCSLANAHKRR